MKKLLITGAAAAGLLGAGLFYSQAQAYNQADCSYATVPVGPNSGPQVGVQADPGGMPGNADAEVGGCLNTGVAPFEGGAAGVGVGDGKGNTACGTSTGVYAVADGDNANTPVVVANPLYPTLGPPTVNVGLTGYAGLSNYDSAGTGSDKGNRHGGPPFGTPGEDPDTDNDSNGGCDFGDDEGIIAPPVILPLPIACGFTSSPNWNATERDGCSIP